MLEGRCSTEVSVVPDERHCALSPQDSPKFPRSFLDVEPVKRLCGRHDVNGVGRESGVLGRASDALKFGVLAKEDFGRPAHRVVGLDSDHATPGIEEEAREDSGARPDIHDRARARLGVM